MHTHYDNLKISRDAPPEVIRAAYKALSQKHHPDRNSGSSESHRVMAIINAAYDVLTDPVKRAEHDAWIQEQEASERAAARRAQGGARPGPESSTASTASAGRPRPETSTSVRGPAATKASGKSETGNSSGSKGLFVIIVAGIAIYSAISTLGSSKDSSPQASSWTPPTSATPSSRAPTASAPGSASRESSYSPAMTAAPVDMRQPYVRTPMAPNGQYWPEWTGYVSGYPILKAGGLSSLIIDNSRNDADVFLKVFSLADGEKVPVRFAFIKAGTSFEFSRLSPGDFDVRYMDLKTGKISRSERFELEEVPEYNGTRFSKTTLTLYKVRNGNTWTYEISESEF